MTSLVLASLAWSLSFGLIADRLTGFDPLTLAGARLLLAAVVFAPWLGRTVGADRFRLAALGAVQFGFMYQLYLASYATLPGHAVAMFTVTTPVFVVLLDGCLKRSLLGRDLTAAFLAVVGALLIKWQTLPGNEAWRGIALLQGANICFAAGQVVYRHWRRSGREVGSDRLADVSGLAWMYLGAAVVGVVGAAIGGTIDIAAYTPKAIWAVLYLGILPTGVAFWLWNRGVARTAAGLVAVINNLKVPLAVAIAGFVFGEDVDVVRLLPGAALVLGAAVWVSQPRSKQ